MSLHYLLDGYNVIHKMPPPVPSELEEQRQGLVRLIEIHRPQGSLRNTITVVFDGQPGICGPELSTGVKVIFTQHQSADDKIKAVVGESPHPKDFVVVTDDRDIQYAVRAAGAKVLAVADFLSRTQTSPAKKSAPAEKRISKSAEAKITSELQDIWLKKKKKPS